MKRVLLFTILALSPDAGWAAFEPLVGEVDYFASNFCPVGYMPTDGRILLMSSNTALFSLLGNAYGATSSTGPSRCQCLSHSSPNLVAW